MNTFFRALADAFTSLVTACFPALVVGSMFAGVAVTVPLLRAVKSPAPVAPMSRAAVPATTPPTLLESTMFSFDSSQLTDEGRRAVGELAQRLRADLAGAVVVIGHADRLGQANRNDRLSQMRAQVVRGELTRQGIDDHRIVSGGVGSRLPVTAARDCSDKAAPSEQVECLRRDRRVEVWLPISAAAASTPASAASVPEAR